MHKHTRTQKPQSNPGFALVATVSMMVLLAMVALAMLSLATIEQRSSGQTDDAMRTARANARMALMVAIGELQEAAGSDQRVTATASILGNSINAHTSGTTALDGRKHWMGVWDTSNYSPATADNKTFVRWLVSSPDPSTMDVLGEVATAPGADDVVIFEGADAASTVEVPKVEVATTTAGNRSYYAYWVEDEGVKADLAWYEGNFADADREQAARLSASPGVDHGVFEGPFASGVSYPLKKGSGYVDGLEKAVSPADMPLVMSDTSDHSDWLKQYRHDMGMYSRAVLADVKNGGLRRDLSLAFEMDGSLEADAAAIFNQQDGEFVGGNDKYKSAHDCPGMPVRERYLFRETRTTGGPFSNHVIEKTSWMSNRNASVSRGPTWWSLRDYHNLYKHLEKSGSNYALKARTYYPNRRLADGTTSYAFSEPLDTIRTWADHRDTDYRKPFQGPYGNTWTYLYRPARANYSPVLLGTTFLLSVKTTRTPAGRLQLAIIIDPIFYFWNPHNRKIKADNLMVHFETGFPGQVGFTIQGIVYDAAGNPIKELDADGNPTTVNKTSHFYNTPLWKMLNCNFNNYLSNEGWNGIHGWGNACGFFIEASASDGQIDLEPGEVVAATATDTAGQSYLGYDPMSNTSGITMNSLDLWQYGHATRDPRNSWYRDYNPGGGFTWRTTDCTNKPIIVSPSATLNLGFTGATGAGNNTGRFFMDLSIPYAGVTVDDIRTWKRRQRNAMPGNQVQYMHMQLTSKRHEYVHEDTAIFSTPKFVSSFLDSKTQFGMFSYLMKPARWTGQGTKTWIEPFARFNPAPVIINKDWWAAVPPNMIFNFTSSENPNDLINSNGVNFSASDRRAFWGKSFASDGSTRVPVKNIPAAPLMSLAEFAHANISFKAEDAFNAIGNSLPSPVIPLVAPFGRVNTGGGGQTHGTGSDVSWNCNDTLFDRYYLSGIAPEFDYGGGVTGTEYRDTGTLAATLTNFYGNDYKVAKANPALEPYIPQDKTPAGLVAELTPSASNGDAYKKLGAYSLVKGAFNINSTSVAAWEAFLRVNRGMGIQYVEGGSSTGSDTTPFPSATHPSAPADGVQPHWAGLSRLTNDQIRSLAEQIVEQVKERGPFMSISNFVNRKVGGTVGNHHHAGAIQAAIYKSNVTNPAKTGADGVNFQYWWHLNPIIPWPEQRFTNVGYVNSSNGTPTVISQADILKGLAPRMNARSDTFRIRGYGEVRDANGDIIASATCEAVVQRMPEYMEHRSDPDSASPANFPWDDDTASTTDLIIKPALTDMNKKYGRKFKVQQFRWLDDSEI